MKKCKYSKDYKGYIKPACNYGKGCDACNEIWKKHCPHKFVDLELNKNSIYCNSCDQILFSELNGFQIFVINKLFQLSNLSSENSHDIETILEKMD